MTHLHLPGSLLRLAAAACFSLTLTAFRFELAGHVAVTEPVASRPENQAVGVIAFASLGPRHWDLCAWHRDGSTAPITENAALDYNASFSPEGKRIAFVSNRDGNLEIYTMNRDGSGLRKLIGGGGRNNHPIFSPDGRWIVFTSQRAGFSAERIFLPSQPQPYGDLFIVRLDGSRLTRLTHNAFEEGTPAWGAKAKRPVEENP